MRDFIENFIGLYRSYARDRWMCDFIKDFKKPIKNTILLPSQIC